MDPALIDDARVVEAARNLDLELAPAHVPGVVMYFRMIAGMAVAVNDFPLGTNDEHAAIFTPCSPPTRD